LDRAGVAGLVVEFDYRDSFDRTRRPVGRACREEKKVTTRED
jgi:hypothetical protein